MRPITTLALLFSLCMVAMAADKPRVFVLTDIENEPDDAMSMVRFLTYANHVDIEGLAATTSLHQQRRVAPERIRRIVQAYGKVRDNLERHEQGFPNWRSVAEPWLPRASPSMGWTASEKGKTLPPPRRSSRPPTKMIHVQCGLRLGADPTVLAQALWKVRETRSAEELNKFVAKLRVFIRSRTKTIVARGSARSFPTLFYVASPGFHPGGAYHHATWSGISGDYFHARCPGADFSLVTNEWLDKEHPPKRATRKRVSALGIPDGGRHAVVPKPYQQRIERSQPSRLGRLGWSLRVLHASDAKVVLAEGDTSFLVRCRR